MKNNFLARLPSSILILLLTFVSLIVIDNFFSDWPLYIKIIIPCIFVIIGIVRLLPKKQPTENQTTSTTSSSNNGSRFLVELIGFLFYATIVFGAIFLIYMMWKVIYNDYTENIQNRPKTKIINPLPIGHDNKYLPDEDLNAILQYNVITDVFQVKTNQRFSLHFDYDIAYRIVPPDEKKTSQFITLIKKEEHTPKIDADQGGMLQVVSLKEDTDNILYALRYTSIYDQ